jgi:hypothetical protein
VRQKAGRITAAGMTKEVKFTPVKAKVGEKAAETVNDLIDEAYRAKYKRSKFLAPMIGARARSATVRVMPRKTKA